jgi:hypothetical protein
MSERNPVVAWPWHRWQDRTPENHPEGPSQSPDKILTFEVDVCANPGKFGVNFGAIYVQNPGKTLRLDVGMSHNPGKILGLASVCTRNFSWATFFWEFFCMYESKSGYFGLSD